MSHQLKSSDPTAESFHNLYGELAGVWSKHQDLRTGRTSFKDLAESSLRLHEAREEMWKWWYQQYERGA